MSSVYDLFGILCLWLMFTTPVDASCDLTGDAWPVPAWKNIMRKTSISTCESTTRGDGHCDNTNNMSASSCEYDGGDCCMSTCVKNCVLKQQSLPLLYGGDLTYSNLLLKRYECIALCGVVPTPDTNCPYQCLDDDYMGKGEGYTSWCEHNRGTQVSMSNCFSTFDDVVRVMRECVIDDRSHGNGATASTRCGNQTMDCTLADVSSKIAGCHIHPDLCTKGNCCDVAIQKGWITLAVKTLPDKCDLLDLCDADCFATMAQCVRTNKACKGGCCKCTENEWFGPNCEQPLCWPKCRNGKCVAPNTCFCHTNWSGESCEIPVCSPNCVAGQGICVNPNVCECFYGYEGSQCELPKSTPPCINGAAVAPDVCRCDPGWGGRICDYPLCQSYPVPSSDCVHGICASPWTCACEPGWSVSIPLGIDGMALLPEYWKGRDTSSLIPVADFVYGDTRFVQTAESKHTFSQYSAFQCTEADCRLVVDAHCSACEANLCIACDSGYYLDASDRCSKCQLKFGHCRACTFSTCTACDPLFVLIEGACVSDGIIEFSSPKYHGTASSQYVQVEVIRTYDSLVFDFQKRDSPLRLLLHTTPVDEGGAVFSSSDAYSDFESTRIVVELDPVASEAVEPSARSEARGLVTLKQTVQIEVFDNLRYDAGVRFFSVKLIFDPETVSGSAFPVRPEPGQSAYAGRLEDDPITEAKIIIWDASNFDYTTCEVDPGFITSDASFIVGMDTQVLVRCSKCVLDELDLSGCATWAYWDDTDDFVLVTTNSVAGVASLATTTLANSIDANGYLEVTVAVPGTTSTTFSVDVKVAYPGVIASQFIWSSNPLPGQAPDILRLEHMINRRWLHGQDAPASLLYSGYIRFDCFPADGLPANIGIAISMGGYIMFTFGEEEIESTRGMYPLVTDAEWQVPVSGSCELDGGIFCLSSPTFVFTHVVPFTVLFKPSQQYYQRPAGVEMVYQSNTDISVWTTVPQECLYGGVNIPQSPLQGLQTESSGP